MSIYFWRILLVKHWNGTNFIKPKGSFSSYFSFTAHGYYCSCFMFCVQCFKCFRCLKTATENSNGISKKMSKTKNTVEWKAPRAIHL